MPNELIHIANGTLARGATSQRMSRQTIEMARHIVEETRLAGLQVDASVALAGHAMQGIVAVDNARKQLAGEDVALNLALSEIEQTCIQQVARLQQANNARDNCFGL